MVKTVFSIDVLIFSSNTSKRSQLLHIMIVNSLCSYSGTESDASPLVRVYTADIMSIISHYLKVKILKLNIRFKHKIYY